VAGRVQAGWTLDRSVREREAAVHDHQRQRDAVRRAAVGWSPRAAGEICGLLDSGLCHAPQRGLSPGDR
jgi:hypothetical protein